MIRRHRYAASKKWYARFVFSRCVLALMFCQADDLFRRTKTEFLIFAVPGSTTHYGYPYLHSTSKRVDQYFARRAKLTVMEFLGGLEGFCVSGIDCESVNDTLIDGLLNGAL